MTYGNETVMERATMCRVLQRMLALVVCTLALPWVAAGQTPGSGPRDIHRLGGSTALYKPPLTTVASLKGVVPNAVEIQRRLG